MFIKDGKRINIYAPIVDGGIKYPNATDPVIRVKLGISEIPDPTPPVDYDEDTYYKTEQETEPYVIYTKKEKIQLKQQRNAKRKARIEEIESKQMRALREAILSGDKVKLQEIEDTIVAIRGHLEVEDES